MFLRVSKVKRENKSYSYAQIVQSYRRKEDGLPAHRVVANLGQLSELEIDNLRAAFKASKQTKTVVIAKTPKIRASKIPKPTQNLVYLDIAVLLEFWKQAGLKSLLQDVLPNSRTEIPAHLIIAILCIHRIVDPGSKLSATRWYPTTALPELTAVPKIAFNNSRIHRALYDLEQATAVLMAKLPDLYEQLASDSTAYFLDISDAIFCGVGPSFAKKGLSKDGAIRRKIGIVLLCNKDGLPVRWEVVSGSATDSVTMTNTLNDIKDLTWVKGVPLVCDRAMGRTSLVHKMHDMGINFLTALSRTEYANYSGTLEQSRIEFPIDYLSEKEIAARALKLISKNKKFTKVGENLFTTDLGKIDVAVLSDGDDFRSQLKYQGNRIQAAMQLGRKTKQLVIDGKYGSIMAAGASLGLKPGLSAKYHNLTKLPEQVQLAILDGEAANCSINRIEKIAINEQPNKMFEKFYDHVRQSNKSPKHTKRIYNQASAGAENNHDITKSPSSFTVRAIAYFNPEMYADQKDRSRRWLQKIRDFESDLNRRLSARNSRRSKASVHAEIDRVIRKKDLIQCFDIKVTEKVIKKQKKLTVEMKLKEDAWEKRHLYDGFCILVAHPQCQLSAAELCQLYRGKDVVEKDFQTIKSVLQVRPIHHRADLKVKAHVSICMLALLMERRLKKTLKATVSVGEAIDSLHQCHLNKYVVDGESLYTITEIDERQQRVLEKLHMLHLADDNYLLERLSHQ